MPALLQVPLAGVKGGLEKNGVFSSQFFFHISRNVMITLLIILVSLHDCLPYLDENIHLYEAHCLVFCKIGGQEFEKKEQVTAI